MVEAGLDADGGYAAVGRVWARLLAKVKSGEVWSIPDSRYGGDNRPICYTAT